MDVNNYESEYYKKANHNLLVCWRIIAFVLFIAYIGEFLKGNRTLSYVITFSIVTYLPLIVTYVINKKTNYCNKNIKYIAVIGYLLFYLFTLFTTISDLAWVYIIPMVSILVTYNDKRLIAYTYISSILFNLIYIARLIALGYNTASNITDYEIQIACLVLSGIFLSNTTNVNIFVENKIKSETEKSMKDPLTQSYNRNFILDYFGNLSSEIINDIGISFILIDIDNFKNLNDSQGHNFGDNVLVTLCKAVNENIKQYNDAYLIRMGGDEFAIVSSNFDKQSSINLIDTIKKDFKNLIDNSKTEVTFSIGIANSIIDNCKNYLDLYKLADARLYESKNNGKNTTTYN